MTMEVWQNTKVPQAKNRTNLQIFDRQFEGLQNLLEVLDLDGLDRNSLVPEPQTFFAQNLEEKVISLFVETFLLFLL